MADINGANGKRAWSSFGLFVYALRGRLVGFYFEIFKWAHHELSKARFVAQ